MLFTLRLKTIAVSCDISSIVMGPRVEQRLQIEELVVITGARWNDRYDIVCTSGQART